MTHSEITDLAHYYAVELVKSSKNIAPECEGLAIKHNTNYLTEFLTKLCQTHCIVPIKKVKEEHEAWSLFLNTPDESKARFALSAIETLFGDVLNNEEVKNEPNN